MGCIYEGMLNIYDSVLGKNVFGKEHVKKLRWHANWIFFNDQRIYQTNSKIVEAIKYEGYKT